MGRRQALRTFAQGGAREGKGVDRIGLAGRALSAAALPHQLRQGANRPLACSDPEALERGGT